MIELNTVRHGAAKAHTYRAEVDRFRASGATDSSLIRVLSKGLHLLRVLNEHYELTALELCRLTGIPRPTVHRLLNTLIFDGYVMAVPENRRYRATNRVQALSQGYREEAWVSEIALPVLQQLQRQIVWPSDVATYRDGAMVVRQTTNNTSPVSVVDERVGSRLHVLRSALGRAYLAFLPTDTQNVILDVLSAPESPDFEVARDRPRAQAMLDQVREDGFAERVGGIVPRTFSLAVPIMMGETCCGALNVICLSTAIKLVDARETVLPQMQAAAAEISRQLTARAALSQLEALDFFAQHAA
jgi:IclR family mhp operon transcriptional activator